jgi:hypothetical protein
MSEELNAEKLVKIYVKIRDKRRELAKEDKELEAQLDIISSELVQLCKDQGSSLIRTKYGTISKRIKKSYHTSDWHELFQFVKEHDAFSLLQQRLHNVNMEQFLEENPDLHPPGLYADTTMSVVITKGKE